MITLTGGNIQTQGGKPVPNGSISLQLNRDANIIASPFGFVSATALIVFQFDATGNLMAGSKIYSNAELNPQSGNVLGTYYLVTIFDANGARLIGSETYWQFTQSANSTVNISTMTPYVPS